MRGILIVVGVVLLEDFHWLLYVSGVFLVIDKTHYMFRLHLIAKS